jgi:MFS family permease
VSDYRQPGVQTELARLETPSKPVAATPGRRAWTALGMLWFIYVLNFLSRQLPAILAKPIQDSLHVSDGKLGLVSGLYFALFYCFISIPVGWMADKTNRSKVLAAACAIWSAATMCCGLAATYPQLVGAYMAVGFGEAGGVPPSYSIISDYFPPGRRGTALGLFNLGPAFGATLGIAFGASIAAAFSWRYAFLFLGSIGLFASIAVLLFVREPRRGGLDRFRVKWQRARRGSGELLRRSLRGLLSDSPVSRPVPRSSSLTVWAIS